VIFSFKTQTFFAMSLSSNDSTINPVDSPPEENATINHGQEIDVEIVGLYCGSNGRSCCSHKICGEHVVPGDLLRLVSTVVEVDGEVEEAIKFVRVLDGVDCCNVGFVPRVQGSLKSVRECLNGFVIVAELYSFSDNKYKKSKSDKNRGMAGCTFLSSISKND
jgi:hypothetical protein